MKRYLSGVSKERQAELVKKFLLAAIILFWALLPTQAQGPVYLPFILSENGDCMGLAILEITDGSTSVNLISPLVGLHLNDWNPNIIQPKGGGTYQSSSLAPFRQLVNAVDSTGNEIFELKINGHGQDALIRDLQDFFRLLLKGRDYWLSKWQDVPVYLKAQASCEANIRYAHLVNFTVEQLDNPYGQPFFSANLVAAMDEITLGVERLHWAANPPGSGSCAEASSVQEWAHTDQWTVASNTPTGLVDFIGQASNGSLFAGDAANIYRSTDNGATFVLNSALPTTRAFSMIELSNGDLLVSDDGNILASSNFGGAWGVRSADPTSYGALLATASGRLFLGDLGEIKQSDDNGVNWVQSTTLSGSGTRVTSFIQTTSGAILGGTNGRVLRTTDNGVTWAIVFAPGAIGGGLIQLANGDILVIGAGATVYGSSDDGINFLPWATTTAQGVTFVQDSDTGRIYITSVAPGDIFRADSGGFSWQTDSTLPTAASFGLFQAADLRIYAGDNGRILRREDDLVEMGRVATCTDEVFISNKQNAANLTHIKIDDGGVFTDIFPMTAFPVTLLPAVPAIGDAIYFGIDTSVFDSGPNASLVFDIGVAAVATTTYVFAWEYSDGGAGWPGLTVFDDTGTALGTFSRTGIGSVHWNQPSGYAAEAVDGDTALWIRARIAVISGGGTLTPPTQQNRDIYTITRPFVDLASTIIGGDIPALARIRIRNRSDRDGRGGSAPNLYENRVVVGLRTVGRSQNDNGNFQAYLNISDEQNPVGITVSVGANTTIGADVQTPTGRRATYNPVGVEAMATRATITFEPSITKDFYGDFRVFLRARRTGGVATDFNIQLQVSTGSGGIQETTGSVQLQTTTAWEVLDFGQIKIPVFGTLKTVDIADQTQINIQASAANAAIDLYLYDLILIPIDEWSGDFVDFHNQSTSIVGKISGIPRFLDLDSITNPKSNPQALVRMVGSELIPSAYDQITNGQIILQANANQRLWFLAMQTDAVGSSFNWIAPFEIAHSIQIFHNDRYLGLRGDR